MKGNQLFGRLSSFFYKGTRLWLVGLFLILIVLLFVSLPVFEDILQIDENMTSLDRHHIYSSDQVYEILTEWGESGRLKQLWLHLSWDLLFPLIYFFFLGFLISWLSKRGFKQHSKMQLLNLVSFVAVVDILENISLFILILIFPANVFILSWIKTGLTLTKYYLFGPAILFALVVSTIYAIRNRFVIQK
ncbi:MAG: hypothetical protein JW780_00575 [Clostridiales bacterium]|nr:hypothetical protein [Clostridiales bacterium]